ncbi:unnamed protein product [Prorocentrum cordatum]|uniref:Uncharacterized protein n=1 Tax=Prorocentrum cordatum TaxID=2364126 RepID=A0ABN9V175_9DINO|nr:unnamed protein product [Polarella glacialis]
MILGLPQATGLAGPPTAARERRPGEPGRRGPDHLRDLREADRGAVRGSPHPDAHLRGELRRDKHHEAGVHRGERPVQRKSYACRLLVLRTMVDSGGTTSDVTNSDALHFFYNVPQCRMSVPRGYLKAPTYRSFLKRSRFMQVECSLDNGKHEIKVSKTTVWRGFDRAANATVYANDLAFSVSNVAGAGGILGTDDHAAVAAAVPGCNKKQPINGPYQTRKGPKGKPWQRAHHFR